jgi:hypothetical protein
MYKMYRKHFCCPFRNMTSYSDVLFLKNLHFVLGTICKKKIDDFELWMWRRILRVPWTEKRTNLSVLEDLKPKRSLEATILRLKLRYFGHVMRAKRPLERDIMLGQVEGHRKQGKPWMRWLDSIKGATGLRLEDLREAVQDRKKKRRTLVEEKTQNRVRTNVK